MELHSQKSSHHSLKSIFFLVREGIYSVGRDDRSLRSSCLCLPSAGIGGAFTTVPSSGNLLVMKLNDGNQYINNQTLSDSSLDCDRAWWQSPWCVLWTLGHEAPCSKSGLHLTLGQCVLVPLGLSLHSAVGHTLNIDVGFLQTMGGSGDTRTAWKQFGLLYFEHHQWY